MSEAIRVNPANANWGDAPVMPECDIAYGGGTPAGPKPQGFLPALRWRLRRLTRLTHRIIGAPDYAGYLAHMKRNNPDQIPMTAREFSQHWMEAKYARPGMRCC